MKDFLSSCVDGTAHISQLKDYINHWHQSQKNKDVDLGPLNDYLGITSKEATQWLCAKNNKVFEEFLQARILAKTQLPPESPPTTPNPEPPPTSGSARLHGPPSYLDSEEIAQQKIFDALEEMAAELFCDLPADAYSHFNGLRQKYETES